MPGTLLNFPEAPSANLAQLLEGVDARMRLLTEMHAEWVSDADPGVSTPAEYHLRAGGQKVRARLGLSSALALGLSDSEAIGIAACAELLHNASLIHDDLQHFCAIQAEFTAIAHALLPSKVWRLELDGLDERCVEMAINIL